VLVINGFYLTCRYLETTAIIPVSIYSEITTYVVIIDCILFDCVSIKCWKSLLVGMSAGEISQNLICLEVSRESNSRDVTLIKPARSSEILEEDWGLRWKNGMGSFGSLIATGNDSIVSSKKVDDYGMGSFGSLIATGYDSIISW
jgi:hypothetical protein